MWFSIATEIFKKLPTYFKKFWSWVKVHGDIVLVVCISVIVLILTRKSTDLAKVISEKKENYKAQIDAIEDAHSEELRKRDLALQRYQDAIKEAEQKYEESQGKLDSKKKKQVKQIIEANSEDPEKITRELAEILGVKVHVK